MIALPTAERPPELARAAEVLQARAADLSEAEAALRSARAAVQEAKALDLDARARARDDAEEDPGRQHEQRALAALDDAESNVAVERLRVGRAEDALKAALEEHLPAWAEALERAQERADAASLRALEKLQAAEEARAEIRGVRNWTRRPSSTPKPGAPLPTRLTRNQNRDLYSLPEVLAAAHEAIEHSTAAAEHERAVQRERAELEAEQLRAQRQQMHQQAVQR